MKRKLWTILLLLILGVATSCGGGTDKPTQDSTSGVLSKTYEGYYKKMNNNLSSNFKSTLHDIISSNLKTSSYSNVWTILREADQYDQNNIECIYTGQAIPKNAQDGSNTSGQSIVWNREHVWAKSHGFGNDTGFYAYYDAHHLYASEKGINNTRGNLPFDEVEGGSSDKYGNKWTSNAFEPRDEVKGDIARALFYMVVRYETCQNHGEQLSVDLELEDSLTSTTSKLPSLGKLSTLVKWSYEDPVDSKELKRNDIVYKYQGNRNPFVDNPEFVYYLYKSESNALGINDSNIDKMLESYKPQEDTKLSLTIKAIDKIGTVTANSKTLIDEAKALYDSLNESDKAQVTNYNALLEAIAKYEEITSAPQDNPLDGDIKYNGSFVSLEDYGYGPKDLTVDNVLWSTTASYHGQGEFRLGSKDPQSLESKFIPSTSSLTDGSAMYASFTEVSSIEVNVSKKYGTIAEAYIMYSQDGVAFEVLESFGGITEAINMKATLAEKKSGYFAVVILGAKPRAVISNIIIR